MRVLFVFLSILILSCNNDAIKKDLSLLQSLPIEIPDSLSCYYNGVDTVMTDILDSKLKFVVYFDSLGCSSCNVNKMHLWKPLLKYADGFNGKLKFYFVFRPSLKDVNNVKIILKSYVLDYPIFIDEYGEFEIKNKHLPKNKDFHSFLLDENNNVVLVGNPLVNKGVEKLFYEKTQKLLTK